MVESGLIISRRVAERLADEARSDNHDHQTWRFAEAELGGKEGGEFSARLPKRI